jgi:hypothetical protein
MDFLIDTLASAMSGTRFSGIAVAAANRRALVNQEREAAQRDAAHVKTLNAKEEALLASIRNQLLGGGKKDERRRRGAWRRVREAPRELHGVGLGETEE